jgi:hypothetical protein
MPALLRSDLALCFFPPPVHCVPCARSSRCDHLSGQRLRYLSVDISRLITIIAKALGRGPSSMPDSPDSSQITLLCWILGEDLNSVFPIGIENHKVVGNLKVKIREENLKHIDARALTLYMLKVSGLISRFSSSLIKTFPQPEVDIDLNKMDTQSLNSLVVQDGVGDFNRLEAWTQISKLWESQPSRDRLQIIIRLPPDSQ